MKADKHFTLVLERSYPLESSAANSGFVNGVFGLVVTQSGGPMSWTSQIFAYCERGRDVAFWAEPLNAISNAAFLIAAAIALQAWRARPLGSRGGVELALITLVGVIGIGSFLFHTYATRWAAVADVAPIGIFMVWYLGYALRRYLGLGWPAALAGLALFVAALYGAEHARCDGGPCLNGSVGYLPAFAVLAAIGAWLLRRGHPAGPYLLAGAGLFALSLTLRTIDRTVCPYTILVASRPLGTHFLWHLLNATLLGTLLIAAVRHGTPPPPSTAIAHQPRSRA